MPLFHLNAAPFSFPDESSTKFEIHSRKGLAVLHFFGKCFVLRASQHGRLTIYHYEALSNDTKWTMLSEIKFDEPILQVFTGQMVQDESPTFYVLQSRALLQFAVKTEEVTQCLELIHTLVLGDSVYSAVMDGTGTLYTLDWEGNVTCYNRQTMTCQGHIGNLTLPGPMILVSKLNSVAIAAASQLILVNLDSIPSFESTNRQVQTSWTLHFVEDEIDDVLYNSDTSHIFAQVLRSVYCVSESGAVLYQIFTSTDILCFRPYSADIDDADMLIVSTSDGYTCIYKKNNILWRAINLLIQPIVILTLKVNEIPGVQLYMSRMGQLQFAYLGTKKQSESIFERAPKAVKTLDNLRRQSKNLRDASSYAGGKESLVIELVANDAGQSFLVKNNSSSSMNSLVLNYRILHLRVISQRQFLGSLEPHKVLEYALSEMENEPLLIATVQDQSNIGYYLITERRLLKDTKWDEDIGTFFKFVGEYIYQRNMMRNQIEILKKKEKQFHAILRRVIILHESKSQPINREALNTLLNSSYNQICTTSRQLLDNLEDFITIGHKLSLSVVQLHSLFRSTYHLDATDPTVYEFESVVNPWINDFIPLKEDCWVSHVVDSISYVLGKAQRLTTGDEIICFRSLLLEYISYLKTQFERRISQTNR